MGKKIKVMQVSRMYYPMLGGIERVVQDIAEGLNQKTSMTVLTCQANGKGIREKIHGVNVVRCTSLGTVCSLPVSPSFLVAFKKLGKSMDIIHIHMPFPLADLACILSGYKGKVILWWHSDVVRQKKLMLLYKPIMDRLLKRSDLIMVATQGHIEGSSYLENYRDKCRVIPFGVEREVLKRADYYLGQIEASVQIEASGQVETSEQVEALGQAGVSGQTVVVRQKKDLNFLFIGRLVYYKGCDVMLRAFAQIEGGSLTMIGDGPLMEGLVKLSEELGIQERVNFLGSVTDEVLNTCISDCDVFVLPSIAKSEAFGIVQMEAMAYGKPVINTKLPSGVPYVSIHGQTGLTVTPEDSGDMAAAMTWMTEHPEKRLEYGAEAAKRVREYFNLDNMLKEVWKAYNDMTVGEHSENSV